MVAIDYRVLLDGKPASRDQLDQLETVTVEQQIDMAWQARLEIPICTDDRGRWQGADQPFTTPFARVRVEVRFGSGAFIPLIDGPVVGSDNQMSSQPGQSSFILIVHDDSAHLNRTERLQRFDNRPDHQIAKDLLQSVPQIATTDIDQTPAAPSGQSTAVVQRGTAMQLLRRLARRQGMHAYVLPGPQAGQSIGAFKQPQTKGDGLPDLVLVGTDRNVAAFNVRADHHRPATVRTASLSWIDKTVTTATSSYRDVGRLGDRAALASAANAATRILPPGADDAVDPKQRAQGVAARDSFSFRANGSLTGDCYGAALRPYRVVTARGVDGPLAGTYLITRVAHRLTRSTYTQTFELIRNATSNPAGRAGMPGGAIF